MATMEIIRNRLIEAIKLSGMTQTEIAKRLGVKPPTIAQYVGGKIMPALDTFSDLCEILDVDPSYILGLTD